MRSRKTTRHGFSIITVLMLVMTYIPPGFSADDTAAKRYNKKSLSTPVQIKSSSSIKPDQELKLQQRRDFTRSRELLSRKNVPFEPDDLLDADWREKLSLSFAQMPEMQRDRRVTSNRLAGVYIANKLSLPEKMEESRAILSAVYARWMRITSLSFTNAY